MTRQAERQEQAIHDMVSAGEAILRYTKGGKDRFLATQMVQDAVMRRFEVMGEAASRLPEEFREQHAAVPWRSIIALREVLIQGDEIVSMEQVWRVIGGPLKEALEALRGMEDD